jgi:ZIP family zinc transporter
MLLPGLATGVGALGVVAFRKPSPLILDVSVAFAAGVMLAATSFSLLVPALDEGSLGTVLVGFALGGITIAVIDRFLPHVHMRFQSHDRPGKIRDQNRALMVMTALTVHNVPEGLAVGVAFAAGGPDLGLPIAIAIGAQNIPEGLAAATPMIAAGYRRSTAIVTALCSGLVEPVAAFIAFWAVSVISGLLAPALAFAAAAMLYVVVDELVPEMHARGYERATSAALLVGFAVMLSLDNAFG